MNRQKKKSIVNNKKFNPNSAVDQECMKLLHQVHAEQGLENIAAVDVSFKVLQMLRRDVLKARPDLANARPEVEYYTSKNEPKTINNFIDAEIVKDEESAENVDED